MRQNLDQVLSHFLFKKENTVVNSKEIYGKLQSSNIQIEIENNRQ